SRFFRLVIRSSTGWSERDRARVLARAKGLGSPPSQVTARGFELSVGADTAEAARTRVELAVHGIHSHTGVYLAEEIGAWSKRQQAGRLVPRPAQTRFGVYWLGSFMIESPRP